MSDTCDLMIADARSLLGEPLATGHSTDHEIVKWLNRGQELLATAIMGDDPGFFEESDQSLGFIKDQEEYELPDVIRDRVITKVTRTDLSQRQPVDYIRFQRRDEFQLSGIYYAGGATEGRYYYLRGNKIGFKPTPTSTIAANILIHYIQLPHEIHYGVLGTPGSTTTFTMPMATAGSNPVLKAGRLSTEPNYYVNARMRILTGSNRGLERKITAFNVATRVATIDSAWTIANVQNQEYVILSPLRKEYRQAMVWYAVMNCTVKKENPRLYQMAEKEWNRVYQALLETAELRHFDENTHVPPPSDLDID